MTTERGAIPKSLWHSATRFRNPGSNPKFDNTSGRKLYLGREASQYLEKLKGYERQQLSKAIAQLSGTPSPQDSIASHSRPAFHKALRQSVGFNKFLVKYWMTSEIVLVSEIVPKVQQGHKITIFGDVEFGEQLDGYDILLSKDNKLDRTTASRIKRPVRVLAKNAHKVDIPRDVYIMVAHHSPKAGFMGMNGAELDVNYVLNKMIRRGGYKKGVPILAVACDVADGGTNSSAQALSNSAKAVVYASDTEVYIDASGRIVFTDYPNARNPKWGQIHVFKPGGKL